MPFQIKDFVSIVAAQINHARSVTTRVSDYQPGSVVRTLMESPAVEVEELYLQIFLGLRDAIPVATFLSFGFDRLAPAKAHGYASVSVTPAPVEPFTIPLNTEFTTADGRVYRSTAVVVWAAGAPLVRVPIVSALAGAASNAASGVITASGAFGDGYVVSNALIETGRDQESEPEREARFAEFIGSLSRGTVFACLYAVRQVNVLDQDGNVAEYVTRIGLNETPGRVSIYVYSSAGIPSPVLLGLGQLKIDGTRDDQAGTITPGYRSAGVRMDVLAMVERPISLSVRVGMLPGFVYGPSVLQGLQDTFASAVAAALPGQTLYLGTLVERLLETPGVRTIVPSSNENIYCAANEALVPGVFVAAAL